MKTSKKILILLVSLSISALISAGISLGFLTFLNINFWYSFWFFISLQISGSLIWDKYYESKIIIDAIKEYSNKPFKKYLIPLNCAHCGTKNEVEIDLTDTEFRCKNCEKYNGIHTNFVTAAITEPINMVEN